ncbi:MAG: malate synthase G [Glaciecola sp.]|nr:malate synthase G [Glaciecola sp.]MDG1815743.1 malate synthase G [Glaciecola sp.]MDG2099101.1 malate synthase G [Glaciecola sp.]
MMAYHTHGRLQIDTTLADFINSAALPSTNIESADFWDGFAHILAEFVPRNHALLEKRDQLQAQIDQYHQQYPKDTFADYKAFLQKIGYLVPAPQDFTISTQDVDPELATMAGPQLVVPINNARYALNAANARWGSLYDALYGTDVLSQENGAEKTSSYNPVRGKAVISQARQYLNDIAPLTHGSHTDAVRYTLTPTGLLVTLQDATQTRLAAPEQCIGYQGELSAPTAILIKHNGLHIELQIDANHPIGGVDPANIKDILVESALSTIMDCEDSVAAVDAEDKTLVYQNWLGLMQGTLSIEMEKNGKRLTRKMNADREYHGLNSQPILLKGRSLMFVRNVGHLMTNDAILLDGQPIFEGIMDGVITSLIALHDLNRNSEFVNSRTGSIYIVKPKMHGPEEVKFSDDLFNAIEDLLALKRHTIKIGIMDEERRTSVNLKACIEQAKARVVFINTGFLDRTGDEIHTSMQKGIFAPKAELKQRPWINAYEQANVITGLRAGMSGKAQIGKGMWPIPDQMANMMSAKIGHPQSGANTAWVPSPTAATLHALHYHQIDVYAVQKTLSDSDFDGIDTILDIPLIEADRKLTTEQIQAELDNNIQGILGYVVRWVHQGIGCSKVPDIHNVGLMEDRATLRISAQHIANWLTHGVVSIAQIDETLARMARLVDEQNKDDAEYIAMCPNYNAAIGFQAARDLIILGTTQPSGYTEPLLHERRREMKATLA